MPELLSVEDVFITYRRPGERPVQAVRGVTFSLAPGEALGLVGESGSGKSTLARAILLLQPVEKGTIRFEGTDIATFSARARGRYRQDVQMVFQDAVGSLNPRMTVRQTLQEVCAHARELGADVRPIQELLELVGLSSAVLEQYPRELSGGQCQRISFARALAMNPRVLVADEPVSALDVSVQARLLNLLRSLREQLHLTILLIAHDLAVVRNVCDRICVMHQGVFEDVGLADEIFAHPTSTYTKTLLAAVPDVSRALRARENLHVI